MTQQRVTQSTKQCSRMFCILILCGNEKNVPDSQTLARCLRMHVSCLQILTDCIPLRNPAGGTELGLMEAGVSMLSVVEIVVSDGDMKCRQIFSR